MLSEATERGYVEQVPVMKSSSPGLNEEWYRDKETGEIYALSEPWEQVRGQWERVDPKDLIGPDQLVQ